MRGGVECNRLGFCTLKYESIYYILLKKRRVRMKRSVKRFVSLLLVTVMVLSTNVSYAFANEIPASDMSGETIEIQSDLQTVSDSANGGISDGLNQSGKSDVSASDSLLDSETEEKEPASESIVTDENAVADENAEVLSADITQNVEETEMILESVEDEEVELETLSGNYTLTILKNGEECEVGGSWVQLTEHVGENVWDNPCINTWDSVGSGDLKFDVECEDGVVKAVEYKVGEGEYKTVSTESIKHTSPCGPYYEVYYKIPKAAITGDITINVSTRDYFENIPVRFNDDTGCNYKVEVADDNYPVNWTDAGSPAEVYVNEKGDPDCMFRIVPDAGYYVKAVSTNWGELQPVTWYDDETGEYSSEPGEYGLYVRGFLDDLDEEPEIRITAVVIPEEPEGKKYSYIYFAPDAANVKITEKANSSVEIIPELVVDNALKNGQSRACYLLDNGKEYSVSISVNSGYKFNADGICANVLKDDDNYQSFGTHVNKNTTAAYSFSFVAGKREVWVNTEATFGPVVKVLNSNTGLYEEVQPTNNVYNVKYTDDIMLYLKKGNGFAKNFRNIIKDGSKLLNNWSSEKDDNQAFWLKFLDTENQEQYKEYYGKKLSIQMYEDYDYYATYGPSAGYGPKVADFSLQVSTPITSTTVSGVTKVNGRQTLSPALGEEKVCTVSVNSGASIENLGFVYSDGTTDGCPFLETRIENGKLYVKAKAGCRAGMTEDIILYDTENPIDWDKQNVTNGKITVTTAAPTWAKTAPTVSLASANDIKLGFNVTAPRGLVLDDNYWVAVKLAPNNKTKIEDSDYSINESVSYFHVNADGTIPPIVVNVFKKNADSSIVETLGKGFGTSLDAMVCFMTTEGGAEPIADPELSNILVAGADKKITVATKEPYYADKITLKKGVSKLYAGDEDKIVATVDFGKNATYTRAEDWEILNAPALLAEGITASQEDDNKVKISVADDTPVGKYTVEVGTIGNGVPAKASVQIEVAQTATTLDAGVSQLNIYHDPKKDITATVKPVLYDQDGNVIKSAKFTYRIEKDGAVLPATDKTLTVSSSGAVKVAKGFVLDSEAEYKLIATGTVGKTVDATPVTINIIKANPKIKSIEIGDTAVEANSSITLKDYFAIVEKLSTKGDKALDYLTATIGLADDINTAAIVINEDKNGEVAPVEDLSVIKEIKIPNPAYITKVGKNNISVTTIAGTTTKIEFTIVADTDASYDELEVSAMTSDGTVPIEPDADSAGKIWTVKGSTLQNYVINLKDSSGTETTKNNISGDTLSVAGAKIVNNWHGDCIQIVMTSKTATITRKHGSTKVGTYYITNDAFDLKAPKVTVDRNSKLYTNFDTNQTVNYTLDKVYDDLDHLRISSTNADINELIQNSNIVVSGLDEKTFSIIVDGEASVVKAASYPITVEFEGSDDAPICPATTTNLKFETLKKSFKPVTSYTMSDSDMTSVVFKASSSAGVDSIELNSILNDNIKGKYNSIATILDVDNATENGPYLKIKDGANLAITGKSITGYVKYVVNYADGSHEDKLDKVTINIAKNVRKYTSDTKKILLANVGESIEGIKVYADKQPVNIVRADIVNPTEKAKVSSLDYADGKLSIVLNDEVVTKAGTVKLTVNVIPEGSVFEDYDFEAEGAIGFGEASIPVAVSITVAANNIAGKVSVDTKSIYEIGLGDVANATYTSNLAVPCEVRAVVSGLGDPAHHYLWTNLTEDGYEIVVDTDYIPAKSKGKVVSLPITFKFGDPSDGYKDETYTIKVKLPN